MRYMLCQPAQLRFQWELETVLTNILSLDGKADIVCLFGRVDDEDSNGVVEYLSNRYPTVEMHLYNDARSEKMYHPTIRPYLWHLYLSEDPIREQDIYFQIDSDIIFRELPDFTKIPYDEKTWYGSDCAGYIDYQYLKTRKLGDEIVDNFASILGVDRKVIENTEGVGAQWILVKPTAEYWKKVLEDSDRLYQYLQPLKSNIQKWTAEMWAQLYNASYFGIEQKIHAELDFCRPTDDVKMWDMVKILHNAGVLGSADEYLFYKGKYDRKTPFNDDLSYVRRDKAGIKYVDALKEVASD